MAKTSGRNAPRKSYTKSWLRVFATLDPENEAPSRFLEAVRWNPMDLTRLTHGQSIKDDKLLALAHFCATHEVPVPLTKDHPARVRIDALLFRSALTSAQIKRASPT